MYFSNYSQYLKNRTAEGTVCCIQGATGPIGSTGTTGATGATGPIGPPISQPMQTLGGNIITVPPGFSGAAPIPEDGVIFVGLSELAYTVIFDPQTLYVGRVVMGAQMAAGSIAFAGAPGTTVTVYNVNGRIVPPGEPAIFQGGYGAIVCTERTETSATIRFFIGTFGSPSLRIISAVTTGTVFNEAGANKVVSYTTSAVDFLFDPATCCPYGQSVYISQVGTGSLQLGPAPGKTVIFLDSLGAVIPGPVITQGNSITLVSVAHSFDSVTLQDLVY
jgi:hypothetical protein